MKVSVHNVQMQCIHVCAVTQPLQHACVYRVSCARQRPQEGRGVQHLQPGFTAVDTPILTCIHTVNPIVHPKCLQWTGLGAHIPMPPQLTTWPWIWCDVCDVCDDITLLHSIVPWKLVKVTKCPSLASSIVQPCVPMSLTLWMCNSPQNVMCVWGCNVHIYVWPQMLNNVVHAIAMEIWYMYPYCLVVLKRWSWISLRCPLTHVVLRPIKIGDIVLCSYSVILRMSYSLMQSVLLFTITQVWRN